jgi:N-acetyl-anhydromuramyl-L-alanine amidase AmpD
MPPLLTWLENLLRGRARASSARGVQSILHRAGPAGTTPAPSPTPAPPKPPGGTTSVSSATPPPTTKFYPTTHRHTPNISPGRTIHPTHIVLHHTSGPYAGSVSWCLNPASKVSYHVIVARNGKRTVLAPPTARTWHAGVSEWQGRKNCNDFSLGLAWELDTYQQPLEEDALASAVEYLVPLLDQYRIPLKNIIRHADVSPGRKNDCSPTAHRQLLTLLRAYQ